MPVDTATQIDETIDKLRAQFHAVRRPYWDGHTQLGVHTHIRVGTPISGRAHPYQGSFTRCAVGDCDVPRSARAHASHA